MSNDINVNTIEDKDGTTIHSMEGMFLVVTYKSGNTYTLLLDTITRVGLNFFGGGGNSGVLRHMYIEINNSSDVLLFKYINGEEGGKIYKSLRTVWAEFIKGQTR